MKFSPAAAHLVGLEWSGVECQCVTIN